MPPHSQLDIPSLLHRIPLFSELSEADIQLVARYTRDRHIARGEMLFQRGDQPHGFYFVVSGQVKLAFSSSQGTEKVVEIIGPMQSFGEAVMFMNHPYPVFAEALTDTVLVHVGQQVVTDLIDQDSTFAHKLLAGMAIRLHGLIQDVETYSLRSSTQRVIGYLLQVADSDVPSEIAPLVEAINHHMQRLSAMLAARRRFLADAAHQIRTPLAVLTTQAEYGLRQTDPEEMLETFASLLRSTRAARRLANQMLTLSHAEAVNGVIGERAPFDLAGLVKEVAMELAPLALKRNIDLAYEGIGHALTLEGNAPMLREMVSNLIDNAIRYSPPDSAVTVAVAAFDDQAVVSVCDQGPGIPAAERERVFHRFYRILGPGDSEGSGLGLAIVREIALAHGGQVSLRDGDGGRGLCVEVELPLGSTPTS